MLFIELLCFYNSEIVVQGDCWLTVFLIQTFLTSGWWVEVVGGGVGFFQISFQ